MAYLGKVVELTGGYQISMPQGTTIATYDQIRVVADSLSAAYTQIRDSYDHPTANDHLELARWCAKQGLMEEVRIEAEEALILEPTRREAAELVRKAEAALKISAPRPRPTGRRERIPVTNISTEAQAEFIRRIQPLAVNKCGNGTCHGSGADNSLKLLQVRTGTSPQRLQSQQNLDALLKFVDAANPEQSPLLTKPRSLDGVHNTVFQGDRGAEQFKRLLAWVELVAEDQINGVPARRQPIEDWREGPRITVRPKVQDSGESVAVVEPQPEDTPPSPVPERNARPTQRPLQSPSIQRLMSNHAPDAFDPDEFNRLVHGDSLPPDDAGDRPQ